MFHTRREQIALVFSQQYLEHAIQFLEMISNFGCFPSVHLFRLWEWQWRIVNKW